MLFFIFSAFLCVLVQLWLSIHFDPVFFYNFFPSTFFFFYIAGPLLFFLFFFCVIDVRCLPSLCTLLSFRGIFFSLRLTPSFPNGCFLTFRFFLFCLLFFFPFPVPFPRIFICLGSLSFVCFFTLFFPPVSFPSFVLEPQGLPSPLAIAGIQFRCCHSSGIFPPFPSSPSFCLHGKAGTIGLAFHNSVFLYLFTGASVTVSRSPPLCVPVFGPIGHPSLTLDWVSPFLPWFFFLV